MSSGLRSAVRDDLGLVARARQDVEREVERGVDLARVEGVVGVRRADVWRACRGR